MEVSPTPSPAQDNLHSAVAELIRASIQTAGQAKDFIVSQLPDVVQQLLVWKFAESLAWCIWGIVWILFIVIGTRASIRRAQTVDWESEDLDFPFFGIAIPTAVAAIIGLFGIPFCLNLVWLQIWLAPKVYLIEYAKEFVK